MNSARTPRADTLAIDANPSIRDLLRILLEVECGVLSASAGTRPLKIVYRSALVQSTMIPGIDESIVLSQPIRRRTGLDVIVITALDSARVGRKTMRIAPVAYLTEPIPDGFLETLRGTTRAASETPVARDEHDAGAVVLFGGDIGTRASLAVALRSRRPVIVGQTCFDAVNQLVGRCPPTLVVVDLEQAEPDDRTLTAVRAAFAGQPRILILSACQFVPPQSHERAVDIPTARPIDFERLLHAVTRLLGASGFGLLSSRVVHYASEAYHHSSVAAAAARVGTSPDHLSRTFRSQTGMGVKRYLMKVRVEVARHLLITTNRKAETIADDVGLCDASHLYRLLRQHNHDGTVRTIRESRAAHVAEGLRLRP